MTANDDSSNEVGYGKPPKRTRFRRGVSGNPQGRPKGRLNFETVLARTLQEKIVIEENGVRKTVTKLEAAIKQLVSKAISGDMVAIRAIRVLTASAGSEAVDVRDKALQSAPDSGGLFIPEPILARRLLRSICTLYDINMTVGQTSYVLITKKQAEEMAREIRQIYGFQPTTDEAVKMANGSLTLGEMDAEASRSKNRAPLEE